MEVGVQVETLHYMVLLVVLVVVLLPIVVVLAVLDQELVTHSQGLMEIHLLMDGVIMVERLLLDGIQGLVAVVLVEQELILRVVELVELVALVFNVQICLEIQEQEILTDIQDLLLLHGLLLVVIIVVNIGLLVVAVELVVLDLHQILPI